MRHDNLTEAIRAEAMEAGIQYNNSPNTITYFGAVLY